MALGDPSILFYNLLGTEQGIFLFKAHVHVLHRELPSRQLLE